LSCALLAVLGASGPLCASPQGLDLERIKARLAQPAGPKLAPSEPMVLRPVFKSSVERHPWVPTLEEELHKALDLNALQRQSAEWASRCCGVRWGEVIDAVAKARHDLQERRARAEVQRELAELERARAAAATK
jgi:hypothetical protein